MHKYPLEILPLIHLGWSSQRQDNLLRTEMERGPAKVRRLTTASSLYISGEVEFSDEQLAVFEDFLHNYISDGADSFLFPDFDQEQDWRECRFRELPKKTRVDEGIWKLTLELELLP